MRKEKLTTMPRRFAADHVTIWAIFMFAIVIPLSLSGCTGTTWVESGRLNLPADSSGPGDGPAGSRELVYAANAMENHLEIKKFGISRNQGTETAVRHGLSYTMALDPNDVWLERELRYILNRHGYDSVAAFTAACNGQPPIMPDSPFRALPHVLGQDLFTLAQRLNGRGTWLIVPELN